MTLADHVNTFGQDLLRRYGERVHKLSINASFTCPNRDGSKGRGGCTFCNNASFTPAARQVPSVAMQIAAGRAVLAKRTGARRFIAYFQAYTNTYADIASLAVLYNQALAEPDVIGISVGTRPDCVPTAVLDLLCEIQQRGYEVWLELGLQSASDATLARVNRGHGLAEYIGTCGAARKRGIPVCTHLIAGLPGEDTEQILASHAEVLRHGVDGIKLHPLHVVKGTQLANSWRRGNYQPLQMSEYIHIAADIIERTPTDIPFHRITGTASAKLLLAPAWCEHKWIVLNGIEAELAQRAAQRLN